MRKAILMQKVPIGTKLADADSSHINPYVKYYTSIALCYGFAALAHLAIPSRT